MFSVGEDAKSSFPMVPDDGTREATAMAHVNPEMTVSVNMPAIVSATFVPDSSPIGLIPGDNMPFAYVSWGALQSMVVTTGVTFAVQPVEIGANQVPLPIGDATLVTCGPFSCMMGPVAPPFSIADSSVCAGWDPEVEVQIGLIDNDVLGPDAATPGEPTPEELAEDGDAGDDGLDIGLVTTSSVTMTVKHVFSGVSNRGENYSVSGPDSGKGSESKPLKMDKRTDDDSDDNENYGYNPGIMIDNGMDGDDPVIADADAVSACVDEGTYADTVGANHRPDECYRVRVVGNASANSPKLQNYLDGYSVEVAATDSEVAWGDVDWETNPFEDLECESMTFSIGDMVDVCEMFEDEVDQALDGGWGGSKGTVGIATTEPDGTAADANPHPSKVLMWHVGVPGASADRFKTLWFDDNLNGKLKKDATDGDGPDDANPRPMQEGDTDGVFDVEANNLHDLYDDNGDNGNIEAIWQFTIDEDNDPVYGDFGKVDLYTPNEDDETELCVEAGTDGAATDTCAEDQDVEPDGMADNYHGRRAAKCDPDDGGDDACDAMWSMDFDVTFADGTFGCSTKRTVTISCEWDAQGQMRSNPPDTDSSALGADDSAGNSNIGNFAKCTAS